jgi:hypothetical protein
MRSRNRAEYVKISISFTESPFWKDIKTLNLVVQDYYEHHLATESVDSCLREMFAVQGSIISWANELDTKFVGKVGNFSKMITNDLKRLKILSFVR